MDWQEITDVPGTPSLNTGLQRDDFILEVTSDNIEKASSYDWEIAEPIEDDEFFLEINSSGGF